MNVTQLRKSQLSRGFVNKDMARYVICDDDVTQTYERGAVLQFVYNINILNL